MSQILRQYGLALVATGRLIRHPKHQAFIIGVAALVLAGMVFYSVVEGWSLVDSFYFTIIALSTIGFGDLAPTSEGARLFTAIYAIIGIGVIGTAIHLLISNAWQAAGQRAGIAVEDDGTDSPD